MRANFLLIIEITCRYVFEPPCIHKYKVVRRAVRTGGHIAPSRRAVQTGELMRFSVVDRPTHTAPPSGCRLNVIKMHQVDERSLLLDADWSVPIDARIYRQPQQTTTAATRTDITTGVRFILPIYFTVCERSPVNYNIIVREFSIVADFSEDRSRSLGAGPRHTHSYLYTHLYTYLYIGLEVSITNYDLGAWGPIVYERRVKLRYLT